MSTAIEIPCCLCGTMILPNNANQCSACLAQEFDLKDILNRGPSGAHEISVYQCRQCRKFERGKKYEYLEPESPELLALCLKKIPALGAASPKLHLVDAMWVWTEPHSMRWKVRLTVRTDTQNVTIQQRVIVELHNKWKQCNDCNREFTNRTWHALVQLRQKRNDDAPRKGLVMLEMALARSPIVRKHVLSVDTSRNGFDFYFLSLVHAQTFSSYIARIAPMRIKTTKKLVSTDVKSNTANVKYTVACDMVPLVRDDLVMVHKGASLKLSGRICLVTKMSSTVHLVDASPRRSDTVDGAMADLAPETYYKSGGEKHYAIMLSSRRMIRFVVLDVELCEDPDYSSEQQHHALYEGPSSGVSKFALADVEVARESDLGSSDETFSCVTHLGNSLQVGDVVLGYDLVTTVLSGTANWDMDNCFNSNYEMPDVVLVKRAKGGGEDGQVLDGRQEKDEGKERGKTKRKERRKKRNEKKSRELEEAAKRMGFLDGEVNERDFEQELVNDPELKDELTAAEREFAVAEMSMPVESSTGAEAEEKEQKDKKIDDEVEGILLG